MRSVTHVVEEESRRVRNRYGYDAFGNMEYAEETVKNRFRYTSQQYDSVTGQYYLRARYYNPVIGRFLQEDMYYGDGLNLYAYCRNNPVRYYDPSGHDACPKALHDQMKEQGIPDVEIAQKVQDIQDLVVAEKLSIEEAYKQVTGRDYPGGGGSAARGSGDDYVVSEERRTHILEGDLPGTGHGSNRGNSEGAFPDTWTDNQVISAIERVANDTDSTWKQSTGPGKDTAPVTVGSPDPNAPTSTNKGSPVRLKFKDKIMA